MLLTKRFTMKASKLRGNVNTLRTRGLSLFSQHNDRKVILDVQPQRAIVFGTDFQHSRKSTPTQVCDRMTIDTLPRFPKATTLGLLRLSDYIGTASFAISGSITAASVGMDALGCTIVGTITAIGGGTIRDAIILHKQPFWLGETEYFFIAAAGAALAFVLWPLLPEEGLNGIIKTESGGEGKLLWWTDALGVGAFAVIGAMNGIRCGVNMVISAVCGMVTSTFGGLTRDVLCNLPEEKRGSGRILHSVADLYATTALIGASTYVGLFMMRVSTPMRVFAGVGSAIYARYLASKYNLRLPEWNEGHDGRFISAKVEE